MKNTILQVICLLMAINLQSQEIADFGKVDTAILKERNSLIEKNAEAEVLFDHSVISLTLVGGHLEISVRNHTRIKIYNEKGVDKANIKLLYIPRNGAEGIYKLEAQTYNLGESGEVIVSKLDKKLVYEKKVNNRYSTQTFTLPQVRAGSVIEYQYTIKRQLLYFDDWSFQREIPVRFSNCTIDYPSEFSFIHVTRTGTPIEFSQKKTDYVVRESYAMRNIPSLKNEPYISCTEDYRQMVTFKLKGYYSPFLTLNLARTWPDIIKELFDDEDFGQQLWKNIPKTGELDQQLALLPTPVAKMTAVHDFVRRSISWDGENSIWALDGVKHAWEKKKGNSGEINLILVNLLKEAGLNASPVLVSTRENGRVHTADPGLGQFNTVMAMVNIDSGIYVLDATDKETPSNLIPQSVLYTEGLVIREAERNKTDAESGWGWVLLWKENKKFQRIVNLSAEVKPEGSISGSAFVRHVDYARLRWMSEHKNAEKDGEKQGKSIAAEHSGLRLSDIKVQNVEKDTLPVDQTFQFELPVETNGSYQSLPLNLFTGLDENPFLAEERFSDVFFGYNQQYAFRGTFTIPEGYAYEELPKNIRMVMPDKSIDLSRVIQTQGKKLFYFITLEFKRPYFLASEYDAFREFYKKLNSLLNEQVVFKKVNP